MKQINDFLRPCITDTESIRIKKKCVKEILESGFKSEIPGFEKFGNVLKGVLAKLTFYALARDLSYLELKKERIKNYMLHIESQALNSNEDLKKILRIKWLACKRWLATIEKTERYDIPAPIELLKD